MLKNSAQKNQKPSSLCQSLTFFLSYIHTIHLWCRPGIEVLEQSVQRRRPDETVAMWTWKDSSDSRRDSREPLVPSPLTVAERGRLRTRWLCRRDARTATGAGLVWSTSNNIDHKGQWPCRPWGSHYGVDDLLGHEGQQLCWPRGSHHGVDDLLDH